MWLMPGFHPHVTYVTLSINQSINQYWFIKRWQNTPYNKCLGKKYKIYDNVWQNKRSPNRRIRHGRLCVGTGFCTKDVLKSYYSACNQSSKVGFCRGVAVSGSNLLCWDQVVIHYVPYFKKIRCAVAVSLP